MVNYGLYRLIDHENTKKHICLILLFLVYDEGEILRLYLKHICVLLLLSVFPGNHFFVVKVNKFWPISHR